MMAALFRFSLLALLATCLNAQQIVNGQIYTPGIAIVDAPQPNTPLGGDFLQVALDVTSDGQLQLPPYPSNPVSAIWNITIFLSSYTTGWNFTISNGTATGPSGNASLGEIMQQEPSSTVKHVNWVWPDCLVGNGAPENASSARGTYNISIRQNFRLNNSDEYTIFDLPIEVTNSIPAESYRPSCNELNNPLLNETYLNKSANNYTRIAASAIETGKPNGTAGSGLGGAGMLDWSTGVHSIWIGLSVLLFAL